MISYRLRERAALKIVRETDAGLAQPQDRHAYESHLAEDVYVGAFLSIDIDGHRAIFIVPVRHRASR